jgi:hypothetical protein
MVDVSMTMMPPKVIRRKACLQSWSPLKVSKDPEPKRHPNIWKKNFLKKTMEHIKMEEGSVQCNKYDGCCM